MISPGTYRVRGVSASMGKSPKKGTLGVTVSLQILEGTHAGQVIDWTGWLTEATKQRTAESMALLGFDGTDLATMTTREALAVVEHEDYTTESGETKTAARVAWINDPARAGARLQPVEKAEQIAMLATLRGIVLEARAKAPAPTTPVTKAPVF